jgi:hypothetical protein
MSLFSIALACLAIATAFVCRRYLPDPLRTVLCSSCVPTLLEKRRSQPRSKAFGRGADAEIARRTRMSAQRWRLNESAPSPTICDGRENRQYWVNAFDLLRRGEAFLRDRIPIAGRVVEGMEGKMQREDRPAYPPRATREAMPFVTVTKSFRLQPEAGQASAIPFLTEHVG